jgi:hypothetical protein
MALNIHTIRNNAEKIVSSMKRGYQYSMNKLEEITRISGTQLCLALLVLIKEHKVEQYLIDDGVRYALC